MYKELVQDLNRMNIDKKMLGKTSLVGRASCATVVDSMHFWLGALFFSAGACHRHARPTKNVFLNGDAALKRSTRAMHKNRLGAYRFAPTGAEVSRSRKRMCYRTRRCHASLSSALFLRFSLSMLLLFWL